MKRVVLTRAQIYSGPLILVNQTHPIRGTAEPELIPADPHSPGILLERQAALALRECIRSAGGENVIVPVSGWRSQAEQQRIWDGTLAEEGESFTRQYVALPGCSEHQTGLAIDLAEAAEEIDFIRPHFPDSGPCGAFRRAASRYGFIQRYRREKESLTGIAEEPWHFRYVGAPHAQLMEEHGLCLEEYAPFAAERPRTCTLADGRMAQVSYLPCPGEQLEALLPEERCQVSGDNDGGFFVTVWEDAP